VRLPRLSDGPVETMIAVIDVCMEAAEAVCHLPTHTVLDMLIALLFRQATTNLLEGTKNRRLEVSLGYSFLLKFRVRLLV
jgi:hypothetical protein